MGRYLNDITTVPGDGQSPVRPLMTAWGSPRISSRREPAEPSSIGVVVAFELTRPFARYLRRDI